MALRTIRGMYGTNETSRSGVDLLPGETVISIRRVASARHTHYADAVQALTALASAGDSSEIGRRGPLLAAIAEPGNADPALHIFEAVFGRDSLISALCVSRRFPRLLLETVRYLAARQGRTHDESRAEEPGKIPHEVRSPDDPVAQRLTAERGWGWPYYGSTDATPLFILACARCATLSGASLDTPLRLHDDSAISLRQSMQKAAEWLAAKLESSDAGFLESPAQVHGGLANQTWKDSWDAFSSSSGKVIPPPIAAVEVQALAFDAAVAAARLLSKDTPHLATRLQAAAARVRNAVVDILWLEDRQYFALGAHAPSGHARYQPLGVASSNMGHLLDSGLLEGAEYSEMRRSIVQKLFSSELLCAGGIRTLGSKEIRYRPTSYHNGSCWPWDTAKIARGLRRFGYKGLADILAQRVANVCLEFGGFPEFCSGYSDAIEFNDRVVDICDEDGRLNRVAQPPQQVQAWTVAAIIEFESERTSSLQSRSVPPAADRDLETRIIDCPRGRAT